jgi:hypothetical protein
MFGFKISVAHYAPDMLLAEVGQGTIDPAYIQAVVRFRPSREGTFRDTTPLTEFLLIRFKREYISDIVRTGS